MKHLKHLFAMLLLLCSGIATAQKFEVNGIHYSILSYEDKTVKVTSGDNEYNLYAGDVTIPENVIYDGITYSVTSIGGDAFYGCGGLASIEIPNSVTSIGSSAFESCRGLTSIEIPNSVTSIGGYAFAYCSGLTSIEIPSSVTSIGGRAFYNCDGLTSIVVDENNAVYDSRDNCNAIIETASNTLITGCTNTIIPNSVTSIGKYAFEGCSGLTNVTIGNSVTSIGSYAFYNCI